MGVREATRDDLWEVARIHKARFCTADYTLGQYSVSLIRKFYGLFLGRCVFLVHFSDRGHHVPPAGLVVDGFVLGGERDDLYGAEHAFLRRYPIRCGVETLFHPRLWPAAYGTLRKLFRSKTKRPAQQPQSTSPALPRLLSIAVDKSAEGSGAAAELVAAFESSISGNCAAYELSVVKTNLQAVRFYEKLGLTMLADSSPKYFTFRREFKPPREGTQQEP